VARSLFWGGKLECHSEDQECFWSLKSLDEMCRVSACLSWIILGHGKITRHDQTWLHEFHDLIAKHQDICDQLEIDCSKEKACRAAALRVWGLLWLQTTNDCRPYGKSWVFYINARCSVKLTFLSCKDYGTPRHTKHVWTAVSEQLLWS
jgi:hypothetical protein